MNISKKNMLILGGLALGGVGLASMLAKDENGGDVAQQIKERAGRILGGDGTTTTTTTTEAVKTGIPTQPDVFFSPFPVKEDVFAKPIEAQDRPAAARGAGMTPAQRTAYDIMSTTATGAGLYRPSKKEVYKPQILAIAPAGVAAKGAIQTAADVEARRISRAGVAGSGALTSFFKDVGGHVLTAPKKIATAGAVSGKAISSAVRGVTGINVKDDPSTWRTRKEFMSTSTTAVRGYPGMSKKEAASLSATKERVAST